MVTNALENMKTNCVKTKTVKSNLAPSGIQKCAGFTYNSITVSLEPFADIDMRNIQMKYLMK